MKFVAGLMIVGGLGLVLAGPAGAQACEESTGRVCTVSVKPVTLNPSAAPAVASVAPTVAGKQQLPVTGGEAGVLVLTGTALVAGGAALVVRSRRTAAV